MSTSRLFSRLFLHNHFIEKHEEQKVPVHYSENRGLVYTQKYIMHVMQYQCLFVFVVVVFQMGETT